MKHGKRPAIILAQCFAGTTLEEEGYGIGVFEVGIDEHREIVVFLVTGEMASEPGYQSINEYVEAHPHACGEQARNFSRV